MTPWPEEADRILREKLRDGSTAAAISRYLVAEGHEKSRSAVLGRIKRLGLRATPGYTENSRRNRKQAYKASKLKRDRKQAYKASKLKRDRDRGAPTAPPAPTAAPPPVKRAMPDPNPDLPPVEDTLSLRSGECRWIEDGKYCRARTVSLCSSWCHEHDALAHPSLARRALNGA